MGGVEYVECTEVGVELVRARSCSSCWEVESERKEPKMVPGRPVFCKLFGLDLLKRRSILLLESVRLIGIGVEGLEEGMAEVVGEFETLEAEKFVGRRFFLSRPPSGALLGSSMGVNGATSGVKILRLFLRLFDMVSNHHIKS